MGKESKDAPLLTKPQINDLIDILNQLCKPGGFYNEFQKERARKLHKEINKKHE